MASPVELRHPGAQPLGRRAPVGVGAVEELVGLVRTGQAGAVRPISPR